MAWKNSQCQSWALTEAKPSSSRGAAKWSRVDWCMSTVNFEPLCQKWRPSTTGQMPFSKQATGYHGEEWLPQVWVSQAPCCLSFSLLPLAILSLLEPSQKQGRGKTPLCAPIILIERYCWVRQAEAMDSIFYCAINCPQNLWLKNHNLLLSLTVLWID